MNAVKCRLSSSDQNVFLAAFRVASSSVSKCNYCTRRRSAQRWSSPTRSISSGRLFRTLPTAASTSQASIQLTAVPGGPDDRHDVRRRDVVVRAELLGLLFRQRQPVEVDDLLPGQIVSVAPAHGRNLAGASVPCRKTTPAV